MEDDGHVLNGDGEHMARRDSHRMGGMGVAAVPHMGLGEAAQHKSEDALGDVVLTGRREEPRARLSGGPGSGD